MDERELDNARAFLSHYREITKLDLNKTTKRKRRKRLKEKIEKVL
jgi:hypothetical protein